MFREFPPFPAVGMWVAATAGAVVVLTGPLTPWVVPVEVCGLVVCLAGTAALVAWFLRP